MMYVTAIPPLPMPGAGFGPRAGSETEGEAGAAPARPGALLVVDDDPTILEVTAAILGDAGYEVVAAATEDAALAALGAARFDLILMDPLSAMSADVPDRWEALERIRAAGAGAPTLIFTAYPPGAFIDWRARGFAGLLAKPFELDELVAAVAAALAADGREGRGAER